MALNRLCYIFPTESETEAEPKQSKGSGSMKSCHDQIVSTLRRSIRRLVMKGSGLCGNVDKKMEKEADFHDIRGVDFSDAVRMDSNQMTNPKIFSFAELYIGTNGFSQDQVLGSGGFGRVFKAVLPSDGTLVAVKCLLNTTTIAHSTNKASSDHHLNKIDKSFAAELAAVAHLRHRNLVRLRGWCVHDYQLLLVYDYMPNRSLDRVLFKNTSNSLLLDFQRRSNIVLGLAAALFYLHEQLETQIIHRDVKTSNVMLDSHYNARLGDFGLARWLEHDHHLSNSQLQTTANYNNTTSLLSSYRRSSDYQFRLAETSRIGGTIGYLPPESFQKRYGATAKSDVFSFGIVVLEVVSGRRAIDLTFADDKIILLDWVRRLADDGSLLQAADARLADGSYQLCDMERLIHLGLLCTLHNPKSRPHMKWVLDALCGNLSSKLPSLPSFKTHPLYISLSSSSSSNTSTGREKVTANSTSTSAVSKSSISTIYITAAGKTIFVTADNIDEDSEEGSYIDLESKHNLPDKNSFPLPVVETPREISYKEIVSATHNFSDNHRVAELDFGTAYQGFLENHHHVMVKRLGMKTCPALRARFSTELQNLGRLRHRNLVQLRGWCMEQGEMLVVYDYLASRLLSNMLFHNSTKVLQWHHRCNIIRSLTSAIVYLHEEWDEQVIHRNITSSSIIVDPDMNPRLTSFALAEFLTRNEHGHHVASTDNSVRGIFGYMSPEYMESGEANTAADVYSFGVVVLEMISGQMAVDFRHPKVLLVKRIREFEATERPLEELADPQLDGEYDHQELLRLLKLGLACTNSSPQLRPSMRQIASILNGNSSCFIQERMEGIEEWKLANSCSLSLVRRIQGLGIQ